jgi:hypothetical protein
VPRARRAVGRRRRSTTRWERRPRTWLRLDLEDLAGVFAAGPGARWTASWTRAGRPVASVGVRLHGAIPALWRLELGFAVVQKELVTLMIEITGAGGSQAPRRWRFRCPMAQCFRPTTALYLPGGSTAFGCAQCQGVNPRQRLPARDAFLALSDELAVAERKVVTAGPDQLDSALEQLTRARGHLAPYIEQDLQRSRAAAAAERRLYRLLRRGRLSAALRPLRTLLAIHREEGAWLRKAWDDAEGAWAPAVLTLTRHPGAEAAASTGPTLDAKTGLTSPTPPRAQGSEEGGRASQHDRSLRNEATEAGGHS